MSANIPRHATDDSLLTAESLRVKGTSGEPITLTLRTGDRIGLLGAAGSGKQRLLRTLARMEKPASGRILWSGVDVTRRPRWALGRSRGHVILIWANPYVLFADGTSPRRVLTERSSRSSAVAGKPLRRAGFPAAMVDIPVGELSGCQRVRLALAYAEHREARAILLDDVFSTLIPGTWPMVWKYLDRTVENGKGLVIASRYPSALAQTERILVMLRGEVVEQGPTASVLQHPQHAYTQWLVGRSTLQSYHVKEWQRVSQLQLGAEPIR